MCAHLNGVALGGSIGRPAPLLSARRMHLPARCAPCRPGIGISFCGHRTHPCGFNRIRTLPSSLWRVAPHLVSIGVWRVIVAPRAPSSTKFGATAMVRCRCLPVRTCSRIVMLRSQCGRAVVHDEPWPRVPRTLNQGVLQGLRFRSDRFPLHRFVAHSRTKCGFGNGRFPHPRAFGTVSGPRRLKVGQWTPRCPMRVVLVSSRPSGPSGLCGSCRSMLRSSPHCSASCWRPSGRRLRSRIPPIASDFERLSLSVVPTVGPRSPWPLVTPC